MLAQPGPRTQAASARRSAEPPDPEWIAISRSCRRTCPDCPPVLRTRRRGRANSAASRPHITVDRPLLARRLLLLDVPEHEARRLQDAVEILAVGDRREELAGRNVRHHFVEALLQPLDDLLLLLRRRQRVLEADLLELLVARPAEPVFAVAGARRRRVGQRAVHREPARPRVEDVPRAGVLVGRVLDLAPRTLRAPVDRLQVDVHADLAE